MPYPNPYQIEAALPEAAKVNPEIANLQQRDSLIGAENAAASMYTQAYSSYNGPDPNRGVVNGNLSWNKMTKTQTLVYLASSSAAPFFADAQISDDLRAAIIKSAGPDEAWNAGYERAGVVPGVPGMLSVRDFMVGTERITGALLPAA